MLRVGYRKYRAGLIFLVISIFVLGTVAIGLSQSSTSLQAQRTALFVRPNALPGWILALGPSPGQTLAESDLGHDKVNPPNPFGPVDGSLCAKFNSPGLTVDNVQANSLLKLNGDSVVRLTGSKLLDGIYVINGRIVAGYNGFTDNVNICWAMPLPPGNYLAEISINQMSGMPLKYQWAFQKTDR